MTYRLRITAAAESDIRLNHQWWSENRSIDQANRWLVEIDRMIYALRSTADRHTFAIEPALRSANIRQAPFGLRGSQTHRVLYRIEGDEVVIFRVRASHQDVVGLDDLGGG